MEVVQLGLADLLEEVVTRREPIEIISAWGAVTLVPALYLDAWSPLAHEIVTLTDPAQESVDAARHTERWDAVPVLRDSDTGIWSIRLRDGAPYIVDLNLRTISSSLEPGYAGARQYEELVSLDECRRGPALIWTTRSSKEGPTMKRRSASRVMSIQRLDSGAGTVDTPTAAGPVSNETTSPDHRRSLPLHDAAENLQDLVADVASRLDRVIIATPRGAVMLLSSDEFIGVADAARVALDVSGPMTAPRNAAAVTGEDDRVSELRDTDTGGWLVATRKHAYIVGMTNRAAQVFPADTDFLAFDGPQYDLVQLELCRIDQPLRLVLRSKHVDGAQEHRTRDGAVRSITRLDDWLFG